MPAVFDSKPEPMLAAQPLGGVSSSVDYPHQQPFNENPKTLTWERLENKRLVRLGLGAKRYSRHFQRFQGNSMAEKNTTTKVATSGNTGTPQVLLIDGELKKMNSIAPFYTQEKPSCGFFFSRVTDNKKKKFGIPPSDLVKWRSVHQ